MQSFPDSSSERDNPFRAPRRGQALILAVFVMLLAALLGSTFLVLVASNSRSVTQGNNKSEAELSADDAVKRVRDSIAASPDPDNWSPEANPTAFDLRDARDFPPAADEPFYEQYWTPLDRAMGWALPPTFSYGAPATGVDPIQHKIAKLAEFKANGGRVFIKVPNPITTKNLTTRPFMVESRLLWKAEDEVSDGGDKKWMLAATVIGLTSRDGNAWSRRTLYKPTNYNGGTLAHANFVSNYDWNYDGTRQNFATTNLSSIALVAGDVYDVTINDEKFQTFQPGQTIMVSAPDFLPASGVIQRRTVSAPFIILRTRFLTTPSNFNPSNSKVSLAGALMTDVDAVNTSGKTVTGGADDNTALFTTPSPTINAASATAANTNESHFGNGYLFNLGLVARQNPTFGLRPPHVNSALRTASGQNFLTSTGPVDFGTGGATQTISVRNILTGNVTTVPALASGSNEFLRVGFGNNGGLQTERIVPAVDPVEPPRPLRPANIDLGRYATLARGNTTAGEHGYGPGIYIDNGGDVDKTSDGPMSNSQLHRWWQRKSFDVSNPSSIKNIAYTGDYGAVSGGTSRLRLSYPRPGVDSYTYPLASGTLEERGIRGWISPWEFVPRGATITLRDGRIIIERDAIGDNGQVDINRSWKRSNLTASNLEMFFVMSFDPNSTIRRFGMNATGYDFRDETVGTFNGVIFAEGNVRVRGSWSGRPLTIVSGQNIYVDGNLGSGASKIALLAKRNVVVNPTQFFNRPVGVTERSALSGSLAGDMTNTGTQLRVAPAVASVLKQGDFVRLKQNDKILPNLFRVASRTELIGDFRLRFNLQPTISSVMSSLPAAKRFVNGACEVLPVFDPRVMMIDNEGKAVTNLTQARHWSYRFEKSGDTLVRHFHQRSNLTPPASATRFLYSLRHSAPIVPITIRPDDSNAATAGATFSIKSKNDANSNGNVARITNNSGAVAGEQILEIAAVGGTQPGVAPPYLTGNFLLNDIRSTGTSLSSTGQGGDATATLGALQTLLQQTGTVPGPSVVTIPAWWKVVFPTTKPDGTSMTSGNAYENLPARFLTNFVSPTVSNSGNFQVPLTVSMGRFWDTETTNPYSTSHTWRLDSSVQLLGSSFGTVDGWDGAQYPGSVDESLELTQSSFYGQAPTWTIANADYENTTTSEGGQYFVMSRSHSSDLESLLPQYNLTSWHIEGVPNGNNLRPVYACNLNATIYAQEGSWFVIPMPAFAAPDEAEAPRKRRQQFSLMVNGNVAQCFTPTADLDYDNEPDPDGLAWGAMRRWLDGIARPTQLVSGAPSLWVLPNQDSNSIQVMKDGKLLTENEKPILPSSGEVLYVSSS